ncbi:MAG: hypothetical protein ABSF50_08905 [Burkholderiaceae bacterium]|jgi:hypothetical protein
MNLHSGGAPTLIWLVIVPLIAWRIYRRVRRNVGRQRLTAVRPWARAILFPLLLALFALGNRAQPGVLLAVGAGAAIGAALGLLGLKLSKFERTPDGLFYTPNLHLGIALSLLLVVRILYRIVILISAGQSLGQGYTPLLQSPLTLALFATLAGYYATYAIGLIVWRAKTAKGIDRVLTVDTTMDAIREPVSK